MDEEVPNHDAQAAHAVTKTARRGKLSAFGPAGARIEALVRTVVALVPRGGRVIEVGYDRGAILLRAIARRGDIRGLGIELQPAAARSVDVPDDLLERVTLETGDGFDGFNPRPGDVGLLAGLGGRTIAEILTRDGELTRALHALVLCPSHLEAEVRPALASLGLASFEETLVRDRGRFYEVIVARRKALCPTSPSDRDPARAAWGPRLFDREDPLLRPFLLDARRRFSAALAAGLRSYRQAPSKRALADKLGCIDEALSLTEHHQG